MSGSGDGGSPSTHQAQDGPGGRDGGVPPATATRPDPGWTAVGRPGAPAIVLVHGSRLTRVVWGPVMDRLADEFRLVAVDLPGHGSRAAEPFTLAGAASVIAVAIDEAAGGRAVVVGHSLGGYAAMELAAQSPGRVRGLVITGASQEPGGSWRWAFALLATILDNPTVGVVNRINDRWFRRRYGADVAAALIAGGYWTRAGVMGLREIMRRQFRDLLATYPGRTLIINGEMDLILRLGARSFRQAARDARRVTIPGGTHLVHLDRPAEVAAVLAAFVRSLAP